MPGHFSQGPEVFSCNAQLSYKGPHNAIGRYIDPAAGQDGCMEAADQSDYVSCTATSVDYLSRVTIKTMEAVVTLRTNTPYDGIRVTVGSGDNG